MNTINRNILIVIVLYKLRLEDSTAYHTISRALKQCDIRYGFYIHDNSPEPSPPPLKELYYIHSGDNCGLSQAYNQAARYAKENGFQWILLLDQDTSFPEDTIMKYSDAIGRNPEEKLFAPRLTLANGTPFSPTKYRCKRGSKVVLSTGRHKLPLYSPVNSGMCINTDAFLQAGGYNESVKIDFSDFQFIEKFVSVCAHFYQIDLMVVQSFSNEETSIEKLYSRYVIYVQDAKNCTRECIGDAICYFYTVFRHAIALTIRTKDFIFVKTFFKYYF
jgi:glycosyltransferase involved in cell wall biosynthesis